MSAVSRDALADLRTVKRDEFTRHAFSRPLFATAADFISVRFAPTLMNRADWSDSRKDASVARRTFDKTRNEFLKQYSNLRPKFLLAKVSINIIAKLIVVINSVKHIYPIIIKVP